MATIVNTQNDWVKQAACRGLDPSLFYCEKADEESEDTRENSRDARAVCRQCPVRLECLMVAYENREEFGVWGGATPGERRPSRIKKTLEKVQNEIEYMRIMELQPQHRRTALKKMRSKR